MRDAWAIDHHALGRAEPKHRACETTSAAKVAPAARVARDTRDSRPTLDVVDAAADSHSSARQPRILRGQVYAVSRPGPIGKIDGPPTSDEQPNDQPNDQPNEKPDPPVERGFISTVGGAILSGLYSFVTLKWLRGKDVPQSDANQGVRTAQNA